MIPSKVGTSTSSLGRPGRRSGRPTTQTATSAGGAWNMTYVVALEVVHRGLAQHGVVLELRLAQRRGVAGNQDQLGLAGAKGLQGRLVAHGDCEMVDQFLLAVQRGQASKTYPCRT